MVFSFNIKLYFSSQALRFHIQIQSIFLSSSFTKVSCWAICRKLRVAAKGLFSGSNLSAVLFTCVKHLWCGIEPKYIVTAIKIAPFQSEIAPQGKIPPESTINLESLFKSVPYAKYDSLFQKDQ